LSLIDEAFKETRYEYGLKQKPNWSGTVYGACKTPGCGNYRKVRYYEGGFCKLCSVRHPEDRKLYVLSGVNIRGTVVDIPNPKIRWSIKRWVLDMSDKLSAEERRMFYMTPEQRTKMMDRVDYQEPKEVDPDFIVEREEDEPEDDLE